jgi:hypothetical protein
VTCDVLYVGYGQLSESSLLQFLQAMLGEFVVLVMHCGAPLIRLFKIILYPQVLSEGCDSGFNRCVALDLGIPISVARRRVDHVVIIGLLPLGEGGPRIRLYLARRQNFSGARSRPTG